MIPYGRQDITESDIQAVVDVLQSEFLTQGPTVEKFEQRVANYCGASNALALNSSTSSLHLACLALDVGPGDIVWTSPITFVASSNCALYCGAEIYIVDIDPITNNISCDKQAKKLRTAKLKGTLPKVVIPVHLTGQSCDMEQISKLSIEYGFRIIEDASHAIGGQYNGHRIGSCKYSDICVFSFHPVKIITTGEGGTILTNNDELAVKMKHLRSHGITRDPVYMTNKNPSPWHYEQIAQVSTIE